MLACRWLPINRIREKPFTFDNVVPTGKSTATIPRYALTLLGVTLELGGTAFTKAMITRIVLRMGSRPIWNVTGPNLQKVNAYLQAYEQANFLEIDFTDARNKDLAGEFIGGIDMTRLPAGRLRSEVDIAGATAPTLTGLVSWGPAQNNGLIRKLLEYTFNAGVTGRNSIPLDFMGALVQRIFIIYSGTDWCQAAGVATAWAGNTGNGAMGAIAVAAGTKVGTYKLVIIEPGANVGTFIIFDPDGIPISKAGAVAAAYNSGGLAFTLADGAADFISGDGFDIVVSEVTDGNCNRVEIKKNGRVVFDRTCTEARFEAKDYNQVPQSKTFVVDFQNDRHSEGLLRTSDIKSLEVNTFFTAADANVTIMADILDEPNNN